MVGASAVCTVPSLSDRCWLVTVEVEEPAVVVRFLAPEMAAVVSSI